MNENNETPRVYEIPENFVDEGRIIQGMFRTRNFVEGVILAILVVIPSLFIPFGSIQTRIAFMVAIGGPLFLVGASGINGDPVSLAIKHLFTWRKDGKVMLYNAQTKVLQETPLDAMMAKPTPGDKILDIMDSIREKRKERASDVLYVEGETFEFEEDEELIDLYVTDEDDDAEDSESQGAETEGTETTDSEEKEPAPEGEQQQKKKKRKSRKDRKKNKVPDEEEQAADTTSESETEQPTCDSAPETAQEQAVDHTENNDLSASTESEINEVDNVDDEDVEIEIDVDFDADDQEGDLF